MLRRRTVSSYRRSVQIRSILAHLCRRQVVHRQRLSLAVLFIWCAQRRAFGRQSAVLPGLGQLHNMVFSMVCGELAGNNIQLLSSTQIDMTSTAAQPLYAVPTAATCVLTRVSVRAATVSPGIITLSTGWDAGGSNASTVALVSLGSSNLTINSTLVTTLPTGTSGQTLSAKMGLAAASGSCIVDVFGYLV